MVRRGAGGGVFVELVRRHVVHGEHDLDVVLLGLLDQGADVLGPGLVEERVADADVLESFLESERHATTDDQGVDLKGFHQ